MAIAMADTLPGGAPAALIEHEAPGDAPRPRG